DDAITVRESPPVAVAMSEVPRSMSVTSAGAPATPLPATPTLTTEMTPCPAAFGESCGRYIFCFPLTVTMPKAPEPPVCPAHVHVLGSQPLLQFPSHSSLFPLSTMPSPHMVSDAVKCLRFGFPLLCERVPLICLQPFWTAPTSCTLPVRPVHDVHLALIAVPPPLSLVVAGAHPGISNVTLVPD